MEWREPKKRPDLSVSLHGYQGKTAVIDLLERDISLKQGARGVVKPAFQMAYNEDVIGKHLFDFKLTDIIPNDSESRVAMTEDQQERWMTFIREDV